MVNKQDRQILRNLGGKFGNEEPDMKVRLAAAARPRHGKNKP